MIRINQAGTVPNSTPQYANLVNRNMNTQVVFNDNNVLDEFVDLFGNVPMPHMIRALGDVADWLKYDDQYYEYLNEKGRLSQASLADVFVASEDSKEAGEEVLSLIIEQYPQYFQRQGHTVVNLLTNESFDLRDVNNHPLLVAGHLVREDFCLMKIDDEGEYRLVAASLHFPSRWKLNEKYGKTMAGIHKPVPGYAQKLEKRVDRYASGLKIDKPGVRFNLLIHDDPTLHQPTPIRNESNSINLSNAGEKLYLRVERQTMRRLPKNQDYILFTIRTYIFPLNILTKHRDIAAQLLDEYTKMPPEYIRYKNGTNDFIEPLVEYLRQCANQH